MGREYRGSELANLDWHLSICSKSDCLVILASGISRLNLNISVNETGRLFDNKRPAGLIAPPFIISFLATGN